MFNYVTVEFPYTDIPLQRVYQFTLQQARYQHEMIEVVFRDWDPKYTSIRPGFPVRAEIRSGSGSRTFEGVVYQINPNVSPGKRFVSMVIAGASFQLKQGRQRIYTNTTADKVIQEVAKENNFSCLAVPHPRVYAQIAQAGHTDLEFINRLAMQSGYAITLENTHINFKPALYDYTNFRDQAPLYILRDANDPAGSTLYKFNASIGDALKHKDSYKSIYNFVGVDLTSAKSFTVKTTPFVQDTKEFQIKDIFDSFATTTVAPTPEIAEYEARAAVEINRFSYRAFAEIEGDPTIRPLKPVRLEGIGSEYSGFWIVLASRHIIVEESTNVFKYITQLELGTDSLGQAAPWTDPVSLETTRPTAVSSALPESVLVADNIAPNLAMVYSGELPTWKSSKSSVGFVPTPRTPVTDRLIKRRKKVS